MFNKHQTLKHLEYTHELTGYINVAILDLKSINFFLCPIFLLHVVVQLYLDMEISVFFARFYGTLFIILGLQAVFANLLGRTIKMTEDKAITVSTGYITFLLGLITVILHNVWVADWQVAITILGWSTLIKGGMKIGFPEHVHKQAQMFKAQQKLWGGIIVLLGAWLFWMSF